MFVLSETRLYVNPRVTSCTRESFNLSPIQKEATFSILWTGYEFPSFAFWVAKNRTYTRYPFHLWFSRFFFGGGGWKSCRYTPPLLCLCPCFRHQARAKLHRDAVIAVVNKVGFRESLMQLEYELKVIEGRGQVVGCMSMTSRLWGQPDTIC